MATIVKCTESDYAVLAGIWERSVRATHDFLSEEDLCGIKAALVPDYFPAVELYAAVEGDTPVGFIGLSADRIEMLFVDSDRRGCGYGSLLTDFVVRQGASKVDVNEQNPAALGFYLSKGFRPVSRDATDEAGRPYPILHLSLIDLYVVESYAPAPEAI